MIYLIEERRTIGAFRTITATSSFKEALRVFEDAKEKAGFGMGYDEIYKDGDKKDPSIVKYAKVGGSHNNTIIRIRQVKEV